MKVLHIITDLDTGGAEMMLYKLLAAHRQSSIDSSVISLMEDGPLTEKIRKLGVEVVSLGLRQGQRPGFDAVKALIRRSRRIQPDVVQGWMYHGNIAATIAAFFLWSPRHNVPALYWNIRQTLYDLANERPLTRRVIGLSRWLSGFPCGIIYNSHLSAQQHEGIGFNAKRRVMIANGFDVDRFRPDPSAGASLRSSLGIPEGTLLVGHVSRFHPMKDHPTLLRAIGRIVVDQGERGIHFLLTGRGVEATNRELTARITGLGIAEHLSLLGERSDIPRLMAGIDLAVSTSAWGEGFPNVIGEAMATALPCVVTDIGDSAMIIDDSGLVVAPGDEQGLAEAILQICRDPDRRRQMGTRARQRVRQHYSMESISNRYLMLYQQGKGG